MSNFQYIGPIAATLGFDLMLTAYLREMPHNEASFLPTKAQLRLEGMNRRKSIYVFAS